MQSETVYLNYCGCSLDQKILSSERESKVHRDLGKLWHLSSQVILLKNDTHHDLLYFFFH